MQLGISIAQRTAFDPAREIDDDPSTVRLTTLKGVESDGRVKEISCVESAGRASVAHLSAPASRPIADRHPRARIEASVRGVA